MNQSRKKFKKELRKHKRYLKKKFADELANKMIGNHPSIEFWQQIKRLNSIPRCNASSINGITGDKSLAAVWKNHYSQLLNSVGEPVNSKTVQFVAGEEHYMNVEQYLCAMEDAKMLAQKLKLTSAAGLDGLQAEHIRLAHDIIYFHISILFNLCLTHNFLPDSCILSCITPIIKNQQADADVCSNYRPITVTSIISKLFEHFILYKIKSFLTTADNQFGFKERHSTDMCVFLLKQIVSHYNQHGSPVFAIFLDASKAFDKVNHSLLFEKLVNRNVPMIFVRLLQHWYSNQRLCVKWGSQLSSSFSVTNGFRQGDVLSPLLFAVYLNQLSMELNSLDIGCMVGNTCINHLVYADDICC